jgi:undecaprenol kinase
LVYRDKGLLEMKQFLLSFKYALEGIILAFKQERNLRFHLFMTIVVLIFGLLFNLHKFEWMILILVIGLMITAELFNTAIERLVDLYTEDFHPLAKQAKDISAAACFIFAICTIIIGFMIFLPKILS